MSLLLFLALNLMGDHRLSYAEVAPLALERNLGLQQRGYQVPLAEARYDEAVAARMPTLGINGLYEHRGPDWVRSFLPDRKALDRARSQHFGAAADLYTTAQNQTFDTLTLSIPIYTGGRLEAAIHQRAALAEAERFGLERARQDLAYEAKGRYLDLLLARENVSVAETVLAQARETYRFANVRLKSGLGNKYELMQAQVALSQGENAETQTRSDLEKTRANLAAVLNTEGLHARDRLDTPGLLGEEPVPEGTDRAQIDKALEQRPELAAIRQRIEASHQEEVGASATRLPQLKLDLSFIQIGFTEASRGGLAIIPNLLIPIFDGGVSAARVEQYRLRQQQLNTDELRLLVDVAVQVRKAQIDVKEADERLQVAEVTESRAHEALRIASLRFQVGAGTSLELVTAQTILANAQFALAEARERQMTTRAGLNHALGEKV